MNSELNISQYPSTTPQTDYRNIPVVDVKYHLLSPRTGSGILLRRAYDMWRDGWLETLQKVAGIEHLDSDDFVRQDEIGVLVYRRKLLCVTGLRWLDLSRSMAQEDSYFRHWPTGAVEDLGPVRVGISSNTYIPRAFRKAQLIPGDSRSEDPTCQPTPLTACLIGLTAMRFDNSRAQKFLAVPRNDRGMNRLPQLLGGVRVGTISVHGIDSDIIVKDRKEKRNYGQCVNQLWDGHHMHY